MTVSVRVYGIATMRNSTGIEKKSGIGYRETVSCMSEAKERALDKMNQVGEDYAAEFRKENGPTWELVDIIVAEVEKTGELI